MALSITSRFDSGAVEVLSTEKHDDVRLRLRPDNAAEFAQWFHFRVSGVQGLRCRYRFENAAQAAFPGGWEDYRVAASYDGRQWFRVEAQYQGGVLSFAHEAEHDVVYYAYFEPYGEARRVQWLGRVQHSPLARVSDLAVTHEGRPMAQVTVGDPARALPHIWIIARQHPGETMAEWFAEGLTARLLGFAGWRGDPVGRWLREHATFHIVPNMNPDGSALGNLRTNALGVNLNREWLEPDPLRCPEVYAVRAAIEQTGCQMFFDIHGDETLPYVFVAGSEMLPDFDARQAAEQAAFVSFFKEASPDFQDVHGYRADKYEHEALKLASKYIGHRHRCLSLTLEMPFKDNADLPHAASGWDGARSAALGAAMLQAILRQLQRDTGLAATAG